MAKVKKVNLSAPALKKEIEMQTQALRRIQVWTNICLIISSIGILLIYLGASPDPLNYYYLVPGIIITVIGVALAVIFGYGHHKGQRNVEKMIYVLEQKIKDSKQE